MILFVINLYNTKIESWHIFSNPDRIIYTVSVNIDSICIVDSQVLCTLTTRIVYNAN